MTTADTSTAGRPALIVVDMQHYFCEPDHAFGRFLHAGAAASAAATGEPAADHHGWYFDRVANVVVPNIARLLEDFRSRKLPVVFTEFGSRTSDGSDLPPWARRHNEIAIALAGEHCYMPLSDPSSRVLDALAPRADEQVIEKTTSGPLAGTDTADRLRALGVSSVVVTGVATDMCVLGMTREMADSGFEASVVSDACATPFEAQHNWALQYLGVTFASVVDTGQALSSL